MQKAVRIFLLALIVVASVSTMFAQPKFIKTVTVSDGLVTYTLYFGISPTANYCILPGDSVAGHAEEFQPPPPPAGIFDARLAWPRNGSNAVCFDQGTLVDLRPFTATTQRDTFRIKMQIGDGTVKTLSWSAASMTNVFTGLTLRYFDTNLQTNVTVDMRTASTADFTNTDDPATINIFSTGLTGNAVEQTSSIIPQEFGLNQNYPNPFNPTTNIQFSIAQAARTDIAVYDVLGRRVTTLAAEQMTPGYYSVQWDGKNSVGSNVASGVYFVRMTSQSENGVSFSAMRKLMLMK